VSCAEQRGDRASLEPRGAERWSQEELQWRGRLARAARSSSIRRAWLLEWCYSCL